MPVEASTLAIDALAVLHEPPVVASVRVIEEPSHTLDGPAIAATEGAAFTVIASLTVVEQPNELVFV
jgi:hypothetical protein